MLWTLAALAIPLCYALEGIVLAGKGPANVSIFPLLGIVQLLAAAMLLPFVWGAGELFALSWIPGRLELVLLLIAAASMVANVLFYHLIRNLGAVFASQNAYFTTAAGIGWSMLLLNEVLSGRIWIALGLMALGLFLVGAKAEAELEVPDTLASERSQPRLTV